MNQSLNTKIVSPTPVLKRSIKVNLKDFIKSLGKAGVNLAFGKWEGLAGSAVDLLASLGLKSGAKELAWSLLYRGYLRAVKQTVEEVFQSEPDSRDILALHNKILEALSKPAHTLDKSFFLRPEDSDITRCVAEELQVWFESQGLSKQNTLAISDRLNSYVASSLHEEWASAANDYRLLSDLLNTPFTQASEREFGWLRYEAWLKKQVDLPLFLESFSLRQVFVPLRAYYTRARQVVLDQGQRNLEDIGVKKKEKVVVDLRRELETWIQKGDKSDAIRLISGGPGCGKSSFAKMFAADNATKKTLPVLFIPLHHFEPSDDLIDAIGKFVKMQNILSANPLDLESGEPRVLLIFDGLDELALQGKIGAQTAREFVREVIRKTDQLNQQSLRVQVIISGRELVVQSNETYFRKDAQVLSVLPYFIAEDDSTGFEYSDPSKLLASDQRQQWWKRYGEVTGEPYQGLPIELDTGSLTEITSQPLLNYLVALALKRGQLKLSASTNLNLIYADLLRAIYERGWSSHQHAAISGLEEQEFNRALEEIALASWHGDGRTTTVKDIENHCRDSGLQNLMERFQHGMQFDVKSGVTQLLAAFYFRQSGLNPNGEQTFEFTHKSFAEYLMAKRLVREVRLTHRKIQERLVNTDDGWDTRDALHRWLNLCGQSTIDEYLFEFILGEIAEFSGEAVGWQGTLSKLMEFVVTYGMPAERLSPRPSFHVECRMASNAEENLLIMLNACARATRSQSNINWPDKFSAGNMLGRLVKQRRFSEILVLRCLSFLNLQNCILTNRDLWSANFEFSDLRNADLIGTDCRYAKFTSCDLRGARLIYGNFIGADFSYSTLGGANKESKAMFTEFLTNLESDDDAGSVLHHADFKHANLQGVNFVKMDLRYVDFADSNLTSAVFHSATITPDQSVYFSGLGANISDAHIKERYLDPDESDLY